MQWPLKHPCGYATQICSSSSKAGGFSYSSEDCETLTGAIVLRRLSLEGCGRGLPWGGFSDDFVVSLCIDGG